MLRPWQDRTDGSGAVDRQAGQITLLGIGVVVLLLFVGGVSLDLWRVFSERRALAEVADAAAAAGANGLDIAAYRQDGTLQLDEQLATRLALENVAVQTDVRSVTGVQVDASVDVVVVEVQGDVPLTLLGLFRPAEPFVVVVLAEASPRRGLSP